MTASSAKSRGNPKGRKPSGSPARKPAGSSRPNRGAGGAARRGRPGGPFRDSWIALAAVGLLVIGAIGAVVQNMDPTCADRDQAIPEDWADDVAAAARVSGFPSSVVAAQIDTESRWDPDAESPVGAVGLAQFMPDTWELYGQGERTDPEASIAAQGHYLRDLRRMMAPLNPADEQAELDLVLAAYNAGPTVVLENGGIPAYRETRNYVEQINRLSTTRYAEVCTQA